MNAPARLVADSKPIDTSTGILRIDTRSVESDHGLGSETSGAGGCAGNRDWLLESLRIEMEKCGIDIRVESGLDKFGLRDQMPAFVLHEDLYCGVSREFELLLPLS